MKLRKLFLKKNENAQKDTHVKHGYSNENLDVLFEVVFDSVLMNREF